MSKLTEEHIWWMILAQSEARMANVKDGEDILPYHNANVEALTTLRDKFGINLDHLSDIATPKLTDLIQKHRDKIAEEEIKWNQLTEILFVDAKLDKP